MYVLTSVLFVVVLLLVSAMCISNLSRITRFRSQHLQEMMYGSFRWATAPSARVGIFKGVDALAVCKKLKLNPLKYVDDCYTFELYYKTYEATFPPVPELSSWPEAHGVPRLFPPLM